MKFDNGKYELKQENDRLICYRHGELWRDLTGDNLIYWMKVQIEELETQKGIIKASAARRKARIEELEEKLKKAQLLIGFT